MTDIFTPEKKSWVIAQIRDQFKIMTVAYLAIYRYKIIDITNTYNNIRYKT